MTEEARLNLVRISPSINLGELLVGDLRVYRCLRLRDRHRIVGVWSVGVGFLRAFTFLDAAASRLTTLSLLGRVRVGIVAVGFAFAHPRRRLTPAFAL